MIIYFLDDFVSQDIASVRCLITQTTSWCNAKDVKTGMPFFFSVVLYKYKLNVLILAPRVP